MTKFSAQEKTNTLNTYFPNLRTYVSESGWKHERYLKKDSIYFSQTAIDMVKSDCFTGEANYIRLNFADDKLYKIAITLRFDGKNFDKMKQAYKDLTEVLKIQYPYVEEYKVVDKKTNEQKGIGHRFNQKQTGKRNLQKTNDATISYEVQYQTVEDLFGVKQTNKPDFYMLEIVLTNLEGTKYTSQGYE